MHFHFGFAGIPKDIRTEVEKANKEFAMGADFCIDTMPNYVPYSRRNIDFFIQEFYEQVAKDQKNSLANTGFAIIYIRRDEVSTAMFVNAFFPHTLLVPVDWVLDDTNGEAGKRASKNLLIPLLTQATAKARAALRALKDEINARASSSPLLLPLRNFASKQLAPTLEELARNLPVSQDPAKLLSEHVAQFRHTHPPQRINGRNRDCFVDDDRVEFHPPGSDRHGFARAGGNHQPHCLLSGTRRLGAPYDRLFHFDCSKGNRGNLSGEFFGCHDIAKATWEGKPHLNIAPNDFVRR